MRPPYWISDFWLNHSVHSDIFNFINLENMHGITIEILIISHLQLAEIRGSSDLPSLICDVREAIKHESLHKVRSLFKQLAKLKKRLIVVFS